MSLTAGIGVTRWDGEQGPALRVRCEGFDGPAAGSAQTWVGQSGTDGLAGFAEETSRFVAAALGEPADTVRTEVVTDATVGGSVIDPTAISARGGDGRVRVLRTTTADGAVVRSVRVVDDGRSQMNWLDLEPPAVLPADTPRDEPVVLRLEDARPRVGRFLVIAPGAARVQLLSTSPNAYPVSKVTTTRPGGVAIVEVINADDAAAFRLVRRDAAGRRIGTGVPRAGRDLLDLWPARADRVLMTVTAEEDFRDFVVARWGELEPVARLVTLDGPAARRVTTDALADLHGQWGRLLDEGMPGRRRPPGRARPGPRRGPHRSRRADGPTPPATAPDDRGPTRASRTTTVRDRAAGRCCAAAAPLERAVLARRRRCGGWTRAGSPTCSGCRPPPLVDADRAVRGRLLDAHTAARAAAGWEPAEWALDRDLDDALDLLLGRPRATRRTPWRWSASATGRCAAARSCSAPGPRWPPAVVTAWVVDAVVTGAASEAAPRRRGPATRPGRRPTPGRPAAGWRPTPGSPPSWPAPRRGRTCSGPTTSPASGSSSRRRPTAAGPAAPWCGCGPARAAPTRPRSRRSTWCATG